MRRGWDRTREMHERARTPLSNEAVNLSLVGHQIENAPAIHASIGPKNAIA
jgi:hypothetical protein